jgi:serine/threonine-protein kinase RsbW
MMKYSLKVPCSKSKLKTIRAFVDETLGQYSISDVDLNMLVLAVDEICANLIVHSYNTSNNADCIELHIHVEETEGITFEIVDRNNEGFNILNYKEPMLKELVKARRKGGLGLMLVKRIMDEVQFQSSGRGNICRLYKRMSLAEA